jgi:hypothetical protein
MAAPGVGRADAQAGPTVHKWSRATSALSDAVDDGIALVKQVGKRTSDAAEELMEDNSQRIKRHPTETVVGAFALGFILGGFFDWMMRRK